MSEYEELTLLFNAFWLSFTFAFVVCCYYETKPSEKEKLI
jgi:hypothetical protein